MPIRFQGSLLAAVLILMLAACAPRQDYRGVTIEEDKLKQIQVGQSTEAQVGALLGSPSTSSTFPDWGVTYYYISSETEAVAFLAPELIDQQVVAIAFDKDGKVKDVKRYGLKDGKQIAFIQRETPTRGKELTFLEQIFGNFGRFTKSDNGNK
jgi:outer membrane protein assembly factor BamE (lipoprotein component of BamABCDE complex)